MAEMPQNTWLWISPGDLETELAQLADEGRALGRLRGRFTRLIGQGADYLATERGRAAAGTLLDEAQRLPMRKDYEFVEPSDLAGIRKLRPRGPRRFAPTGRSGRRLTDRRIADHILGAWQGRCAGCLLGKAAEGTRSNRLWPFLKATRQWPIRDYVRFGARGRAAQEFPDMIKRSRLDKVRHMPVDDDTNYTLTGLLVVKRNGPSFTPADVAQFWMGNIPILSTFTAERVAYRNLVVGAAPPASASRRNPHREWIGAQIRADAFGYVNVGNPQRAAEFAWRDACISHVKNGIYGEMLMAALIAAAPYCDDIAELVRVGLSEIPGTSRLADDVKTALAWHAEGITYDQAVARIHERWDENVGHHWCHTNSNAVICIVALLWGGDDFSRSVCMAVQPCFDTDCNGATVGSIMGMRHGAGGIDAQWTGRLNDTLHTSLTDHNVVSISDLAAETFKLFKNIRAAR